MTRRRRRALGKLERIIGRTARVQRWRRALVKRLKDESAPDWLQVAEFHTNMRFSDDGALVKDYNQHRGGRRKRPVVN